MFKLRLLPSVIILTLSTLILMLGNSLKENFVTQDIQKNKESIHVIQQDFRNIFNRHYYHENIEDFKRRLFFNKSVWCQLDLCLAEIKLSTQAISFSWFNIFGKAFGFTTSETLRNMDVHFVYVSPKRVYLYTALALVLVVISFLGLYFFKAKSFEELFNFIKERRFSFSFRYKLVFGVFGLATIMLLTSAHFLVKIELERSAEFQLKELKNSTLIYGNVLSDHLKQIHRLGFDKNIRKTIQRFLNEASTLRKLRGISKSGEVLFEAEKQIEENNIFVNQGNFLTSIEVEKLQDQKEILHIQQRQEKSLWGGNNRNTLEFNLKLLNAESLPYAWLQGESYQDFSLKDLYFQYTLLLLPVAFFCVVFIYFLFTWYHAPVHVLEKKIKLILSGESSSSIQLATQDSFGRMSRLLNQIEIDILKRNQLHQFLSASAVEQIVGTRTDGVKSSLAQKTNATVLFSDIRGFVELCERLKAEEVTELLNDYFSEMVAVISQFDGEIDKFIGDAFLAVFYDQDKLQKSYTRAIFASIALRERLKLFNESRKLSGKVQIQTGIGINYGQVIRGMVGTKTRRDFTVIGDVVNTASRIEKLSQNGNFLRVVVTESVFHKTQHAFHWVPLEEVKLKGKSDVTQLFELKGANFEFYSNAFKDKAIGLSRTLQEDAPSKLRNISVIEALIGESRAKEWIDYLVFLVGDSDFLVKQGALKAFINISLQVSSTLKDYPPLLEALKKELKNELLEGKLSNQSNVIEPLVLRVLSIYSSNALQYFYEFENILSERSIANFIENYPENELNNTNIGFEEGYKLKLLEYIRHPSNRIRASAALALFRNGYVEVLGMIKPLFLHTDPLMRASAIYVLGQVSLLLQKNTLSKKVNPQRLKFATAELQSAVSMIALLSRDSDIRVRRQSVIALSRIKDWSVLQPLLHSLSTQKEKEEFLSEFFNALQETQEVQFLRSNEKDSLLETELLDIQNF